MDNQILNEEESAEISKRVINWFGKDIVLGEIKDIHYLIGIISRPEYAPQIKQQAFKQLLEQNPSRENLIMIIHTLLCKEEIANFMSKATSIAYYEKSES